MRRARDFFDLRLALLAALCAGCLALAGCSSSDDNGPPPDAGAEASTPDPDGALDTGGEAGTDASSKLEIPKGCNPIASDWHCLLPYPSDHFTVEDSALPSGRRIKLTDAARLIASDKPFDMLSLHPMDGFSVGAQILMVFPQGVDASNLVSHTGDMTKSQGDESATVLLDASDGSRVLHFAELDPRAPTDDKRALIIRPMVRLKDATRYIVAIRRLKDKDGKPIAPPEGFRRLRDGEAADHEVLGKLVKRYDDEVFKQLADAKIDRAELQLAWDFTTRTQDNATADMLAIREDLINELGKASPAFKVGEVTNDVDENIARKIEGTITVPLYLASAEPGKGTLHRGSDGKVVRNGTAEVPFTILVPRSVADRAPGAAPARLLQFGHGFFGGRAEIEGDFVAPFANQKGFVVVACDWWGMTSKDQPLLITAMTSDPSTTFSFTDRVHQGMANFIALAALAQGPLADIAELQVNGAPAYNAKEVYFYGISQGHILGGTYAALSPHVRRSTLEVAGANLSLMMMRARPFISFLVLIEALNRDPLTVQAFVAIAQSSFDRVDPLTYAPHVLAAPYPGSPTDRRVLMRTGIGDAQVPNLASHLHARALGLKLLQPAPRKVVGLEGADAPYDGSAVAEYDFGIDPLPGIDANPPSAGNDVHNGLRQLEAAKEQVSRFFMPGGKIENICDGVCDPE